jgi:hypothetical protein
MTGNYEVALGPWPRRPMAREELLVLRRRARTPLAQVAGLLLLPAMLGCLGWVAGSFAGWVEVHLGLREEGSPLMGVLSLGGLGLVLDVVLWQLMRRSRALARADLRAGEAELLEARPRRVLDVGSELHPAVVCDRGDGTLLYLCGPVLARERGGPGPHGPAAPAFPTSHFTVARAPRSGLVLGVAVGGEPLLPEKGDRPEGLRLAMLEWREAEVVRGGL